MLTVQLILHRLGSAGIQRQISSKSIEEEKYPCHLEKFFSIELNEYVLEFQ